MPFFITLSNSFYSATFLLYPFCPSFHFSFFSLFPWFYSISPGECRVVTETGHDRLLSHLCPVTTDDELLFSVAQAQKLSVPRRCAVALLGNGRDGV
jgi:hypothetical protein